MNDFDYDCMQKKRIAMGAFAHINRKRGGCSLPSDTLTEKQRKEKNGQVKSYNITRPMPWYEFEKMPEDTLNRKAAKEEKDERHICPLQLPVIERLVELWSNPGDIVLDPFDGIGSTGYQAILMGRRHIGVELKSSYFRLAAENCAQAERLVEIGVQESEGISLFDSVEGAL